MSFYLKKKFLKIKELRGSYEKSVNFKMNGSHIYQEDLAYTKSFGDKDDNEDEDDATYGKYVNAIEKTKRDYANYKNNLPSVDRDLANVIEEKLDRLYAFRIDLIKEKFKVNKKNIYLILSGLNCEFELKVLCTTQTC